MKIRNLEAPYDNLHPTYAIGRIDVEGVGMPHISADSYYRLWDYARALEMDVKAKNQKINEQKREISLAHKSLGKKHKRIMVVKEFGKSFAYFKMLSKAFE